MRRQVEGSIKGFLWKQSEQSGGFLPREMKEREVGMQIQTDGMKRTVSGM